MKVKNPVTGNMVSATSAVGKVILHYTQNKSPGKKPKKLQTKRVTVAVLRDYVTTNFQFKTSTSDRKATLVHLVYDLLSFEEWSQRSKQCIRYAPRPSAHKFTKENKKRYEAYKTKHKTYAKP